MPSQAGTRHAGCSQARPNELILNWCTRLKPSRGRRLWRFIPARWMAERASAPHMLKRERPTDLSSHLHLISRHCTPQSRASQNVAPLCLQLTQSIGNGNIFAVNELLLRFPVSPAPNKPSRRWTFQRTSTFAACANRTLGSTQTGGSC